MPDLRLSEVAFGDARPVEGYGPGFFRVAGQVVHGPLAILSGGVRPWGGWDDTATLVAEAGALDVLFVGTGAAMAPLPAAFREALEAAGLALEPMASPAACRTYNVLLSEGRRVGLAALPV